MSAFVNHLLVISALTAAVGYFIWHALARRGKGGASCGGGCDCGGKKVTRPPGK
jgi:hypothetical protein